MGWLGWSEQEALDADVNSIHLALEGKAEMLKLIHFPEEKKETVKVDPVTAFKAFADDHNRKWRSGRRRKAS